MTGTNFGDAQGHIHNDNYELPGPIIQQTRSDEIFTMGLGLGLRFTDHLSIFGSYLFEDRDSLYRYS